MVGLCKKILGLVFFLVEKFVLMIDKYFLELYFVEMKGVFKVFNISLVEMILLNIFYDLLVYCMSIVV